MTAIRDRLVTGVTEAATPCIKGHRHSRPNTTPFTSHSWTLSLAATINLYPAISIFILIPTPEVAPSTIRFAFLAILAPTNTLKAAPPSQASSSSTGDSIKTWSSRNRPIAPPMPPTRRVTAKTSPASISRPSLCPPPLRLNKTAGASFWFRDTRSFRAQNMTMSTRSCRCRRQGWMRRSKKDEWTVLSSCTRRLLVRGI